MQPKVPFVASSTRLWICHSLFQTIRDQTRKQRICEKVCRNKTSITFYDFQWAYNSLIHSASLDAPSPVNILRYSSGYYGLGIKLFNGQKIFWSRTFPNSLLQSILSSFTVPLAPMFPNTHADWLAIQNTRQEEGERKCKVISKNFTNCISYSSDFHRASSCFKS